MHMFLKWPPAQYMVNNNLDRQAKSHNVKKTGSDVDTHWSCSLGLLVIVLFPFILVPDEDLHCSEG